VRILLVIVAATLLTVQLRAADKNPPPISVHLSAVSPADAIAELAKQTGATFAFDRDIPWTNPDPNWAIPNQISIDLDNKSFWECMQEICLASKLTASTRGDYDDITILHNSNREKPGLFFERPTFVGPAATFVVSSARHNATIDLTQKDARVQRDSGIDLHIWVDPRLHMIKKMREPIIESAVDENGVSLKVPPGEDDKVFDHVSCPWDLGYTVSLDYDSAKSRKLGALRGSVRIMMATATETLEIDDIPGSVGHEKTVAGMRFEMKEVTVDGKQMKFEFTVQRNGADETVWKRATGSISHTLRVQLADGTKIACSGSDNTKGDLLTFKSRVEFSKDSEKPVKLIWPVATAVAERDLPFEFKDIPLP
jgi:hypothetical protein